MTDQDNDAETFREVSDSVRVLDDTFVAVDPSAITNEQLLDLLGNDVSAFNEYRKVNPKVIPDLSYQLFFETDLAGANLAGVQAEGANFQGANLERTSFRGANLTKANLGGANLWSADLREATLHMTILRRANLRCADITDADLQEALLIGADISHVVGLKKRDFEKLVRELEASITFAD